MHKQNGVYELKTPQKCKRCHRILTTVWRIMSKNKKEFIQQPIKPHKEYFTCPLDGYIFPITRKDLK
jgi:hypothetical protein